MSEQQEKIYWLDSFTEGEAQGGYFFRAFELVKFIEKVEEGTEKKVVGLRFDGNNVEVITN